jgi:hypothetical protein
MRSIDRNLNEDDKMSYGYQDVSDNLEVHLSGIVETNYSKIGEYENKDWVWIRDGQFRHLVRMLSKEKNICRVEKT